MQVVEAMRDRWERIRLMSQLATMAAIEGRTNQFNAAFVRVQKNNLTVGPPPTLWHASACAGRMHACMHAVPAARPAWQHACFRRKLSVGRARC